MLKAVVLAFALLFISGSFLCADILIKKADHPKRVALVIGVGDYENIPPLKNTLNDASDISKALSNCGFKVIGLNNPTRSQIDEAIFQFSNLLDQAEVGLFYYAGHAVQVDGLNYLIPKEAKVDKKYQLRSQCLLLDYVVGAMAEARNKVNLVFLDCCCNNPFKLLKRPSQGLAQMNAPRGSLLVYATSQGGVASDGKSRNGLFTGELLQQLATPGLEVMDLLRNVRVRVLNKSQGRQKPWESSMLEEKFIFLKQTQESEVLVSVIPNKGLQPLATSRSVAEEDGQGLPMYGKPFTLANLDLKMLPISAKSFMMGSNHRDNDEKPLHLVHLKRDFWMAKYELSQSEYEKIVKKNPSSIVGEDHPVEGVTWFEAVNFCEKLTQIELEEKRLIEGYAYRLPTEAEWEYCCRAGSNKEWTSRISNAAWHQTNSRGTHHPVGEKHSNAWGLHDMHGNVWEWTADSYGENFYGQEVTDPLNLEGKTRVVRGGSWHGADSSCSSSNRDHHEPDVQGDILGFRIVLAPTLPSK